MMMIRGMRVLWSVPYCPCFFLSILSASSALQNPHPGSAAPSSSLLRCWGNTFLLVWTGLYSRVKMGTSSLTLLPLRSGSYSPILESGTLLVTFWTQRMQQDAWNFQVEVRRSLGASLSLDLVECLLLRCPFSEPSHHPLRSPSHTNSPV